MKYSHEELIEQMLKERGLDKESMKRWLDTDQLNLSKMPWPMTNDEIVNYVVENMRVSNLSDSFSYNLVVPEVTPVYTPPVDLALAQIIHHPAVVLIVGRKGGGKSALVGRLQELKRDQAPPYAVALPEKARRILPPWYGLTDDPFEIPSNAMIYIPESYRMFHAKSSQSAQGRTVGNLVNLSKHRHHTLFSDVQNAAHLDRNIISEVDVILVKEPGPFTKGFERPELRHIMDAARAAFAGVSPSRRKRMVFVVAPDSGIAGQLMENRLPTFWSDALSRIFASAGSSSPSRPEAAGSGKSTRATIRIGQKTSTQSKRQRAKELRKAGYSYSEIGEMLGVSKSQAFRLVNSE